MITEKQILEAAKETGMSDLTFMYQEQKLRMIDYSMPELTKFAKHFYRLGLLDGAEKCADMGKERYLQANAVDCRNALRQMADEAGK